MWFDRSDRERAPVKSIQELPEDVGQEDIQERINFMAGVSKGLREQDEGRGIPHEMIREEFKEWPLKITSWSSE